MLDQRVEEACAQEKTAQFLMTVPGVAAVVAAMFISVIDDATRFRNARQVASYLGLVPRENTSGGSKQRLGAITKQGNRYLRSLLIQSAWLMLRKKTTDDPVALWGQAIANNRGKRIAVVAVARRMAGILWAVGRRGVAYDPAHVAELSSKSLELSAKAKDSQAERLRRAAGKSRARSTALLRRSKNAQALTATT